MARILCDWNPMSTLDTCCESLFCVLCLFGSCSVRVVLFKYVCTTSFWSNSFLVSTFIVLQIPISRNISLFRRHWFKDSKDVPQFHISIFYVFLWKSAFVHYIGRQVFLVASALSVAFLPSFRHISLWAASGFSWRLCVSWVALLSLHCFCCMQRKIHFRGIGLTLLAWHL